MPQHFKVHELLGRAELDALEAFAREPGRTVDECHEWMQAHGYTLSRSAVHAWQRSFLSADRYGAAADVARSFLAAQAGDPAAMATAVVAKAQQVVFEGLLRLEADDEVTVADLKAISVAVKNTVTSQLDADELRTRQRAALAEADKVAKSGGSGAAVAAKMRELLGIKEAA